MPINTHAISLNGSSQYLTAADSASTSTTGGISVTAPSTVDYVIRSIGRCGPENDTLFFNPGPDFITYLA